MENKKYKILIIDDNFLDRAICKRLLDRIKDINFEFFESTSLKDGIDLCNTNKPDCIILDYILPDITGLEGIGYIKDISNDLGIVAISGYGDENIATEFIKSGASDYIAKFDLSYERIQNAVIKAIEDKESKRVVLNTENKLETILNTIIDGIIVLKKGGLIISINTSLEKIFGYNSFELIGKNISMLIPFGYFHEYRTYVLDQLKKKKKVFFGIEKELKGLRKDGTVFPMEIGINEMKINEEIYFVASVHDITIRKNIEEALKEARKVAISANKAKSNFLATMSHEIRTPMNGVIGITELLSYTKLDNKQIKYVDIIKSSGELLLVLINDILDFSKIEAGELKLEKNSISLDQIISEIGKILEISIKENNIDFSVEYINNVPLNLIGDPIRLKQIMVNLANNAIKFSNNGKVKIKITSENNNGKNVDLLFEVIDTGIGIAKENQERIFDKFSQVQQFSTRQFGGTGLGLAIVKKLVDLMGGNIGLDSSLGKGSNFWFRINLPIDTKEKEVVNSNKLLKLMKNLRYLIVDDYKTNRHIVSVYLDSNNYKYGTASSGKEALSILDDAYKEKDAYSVVFIDYVMPEMSGLELARKIKKEVRYNKVLLILITTLNKVNKNLTKDDLKLFDGFIKKPFRKEVFLNKLFDIISSKLLDSKYREQNKKQQKNLKEPHPKLLKENVLTKSIPKFQANILVVEDFPPNQEVIVEILRTMGCKTEVASDGVEALKILENNKNYDLIFMDCEMPNMNGFDATKKIKKRKYNKDTKIIAMTANALQGDMKKCLDVGMDDYMSKPVDISTVKNILSKYIFHDNNNARF